MSIAQNEIIYFVLLDRFYGKPNNKALNGVDTSKPKYFHGGNIDGIIEKIPYLKALGITALWITPVYKQMEDEYCLLNELFGYHGYWAEDFNKVDEHFYIEDSRFPAGSKLYIKKLADELHKNGIKLILDMVVNHTGYHHPSLHNTETNNTPIKSDWFNQMNLDCMDNMIEGQLSGLPDMDLDNINVIDYHIKTIISWIEETGIDAIRMDTAKHVERGFWNYFKTQIRGKYPHITMIGEVLVFGIDELTDYQKYWGFDSLFDFPIQRAVQQIFVEGQCLTTFQSPFDRSIGLLEKDNSYSNHNKLVTLLDNHDLSGRFMTWAMHATNNQKDKAEKILKLALTFIFSIRGIPQLYYGTEIGLEGGGDPDNRRDFPWHIFDEHFQVKKEFEIEQRIFEHTKKLIQIRKTTEALWCGSYVSLYVDYFVFVFIRFFNETFTITAINNGWEAMPESIHINLRQYGRQIPASLIQSMDNCTLQCLISNKTIPIQDYNLYIKLEGKEGAILQKK